LSDFGRNPDHVALGLWLGTVMVTVRWGNHSNVTVTLYWIMVKQLSV